MRVKCITRLGETVEVSASELLMRPAVYGVTIKDDKLLLVPQWDGYDFPGGKVELGERMEKALLREMNEETGLSVEIGRFLHFDESFYYDDTRKEYFHSLHFYYSCHNPKGEITAEGFDTMEKSYAKEAVWVPISEVPSLKFYNSTYDPVIIDRVKTLQNE